MTSSKQLGHVLLTPEICGCIADAASRCPVCDWGLAVCSQCHGGEIDLERGTCEQRRKRNDQSHYFTGTAVSNRHKKKRVQ